MGFIIKPLVTEKMTKITDKKSNRYGFLVTPEANKLQIKEEVEGLYKVNVEDVNTMLYAGKRMARYTKAGLVKGHKSAFKKAIVTLKEGETIDFYSNIE
ncbi:MAG: 50S ribosomal protein L23 [Prevotella sp.]